MIQCKWCLNYFEKLAKAHIIPESFIKNYAGIEGRQYTVDGFSKSTKTGWYDTSINCQNCEKEFQSIDDKAIKILLKDFDQIQIPPPFYLDGKICQIPKSYTQDLKRFFLYTLWKCSVSSLSEFDEIKLGSYEDIIKKVLIQNKTLSEDEFSFVSQFHQNPIGFSLPFKRKRKDYGGRSYYHLDLNIFGFDIKIDKQKAPDLWDTFSRFDTIVFLKYLKPPKRKVDGIKRILEMNAAYEKSFKERMGR